MRDIVGLYLNPPDHALVLCVDEKSQCQALERTQPVLPMGLSYTGAPKRPEVSGVSAVWRIAAKRSAVAQLAEGDYKDA